MREIVKAHGAAWIARKAAKLGYQIPSTIRREEVPTFNFWLEKYTESPIERFVYSFFKSEQFKAPDAMPEQYRPMLMKEMEQRKWFEDHLEDFEKELNQAIDFIAEHLADRKNIKRCLKSLPAYCLDNVLGFAEDSDASDDDPEDEETGLLQLSGLIFRNEWEDMKKLEEEGYIILQKADFDEEMFSKIYDAFFQVSEGEKPEFDEEDDGHAFDAFLYFVHTLMLVPQEFLNAARSMTEREKKRMQDQQMVHDIMEVVNQFYVMLTLQDILKIVHLVQEVQQVPESDFMDEVTLIRCIGKLNFCRVEEIEGTIYGVSSEAYRDYLSFRRIHGDMTPQDYSAAIDADEELYDTIHEYLILERINGDSPAIWGARAYQFYHKFGILSLRGPWLRLYALLAVILLEKYRMDNMVTSMMNSGALEGEDDPFYRDPESPETYLQIAFELVNAIGANMLEDASLASQIDVLKERIDVWGLNEETQEKLLELLRLCYKQTPNPNFWGNYPDEDCELAEDFDFGDPQDEDSEEDDDFVTQWDEEDDPEDDESDRQWDEEDGEEDD